MQRLCRRALCVLATWALLFSVGVAGPPEKPSAPAPIWGTDYAEAMAEAKAQSRMMFVFFHAGDKNPVAEYFDSTVIADPNVQQRLADYVCVRLPVDAKIRSGGKEETLLQQPGLAGLGGKQGVAVFDFTDRDAPYYGCVANTLPFTKDHCYSARQLVVLLELKPAMPDQRARALAAGLKAFEPVDSEQSTSAPQQAVAEAEPPKVEVDWLADYAEGIERAKEQGKMLLVEFCDCPNDELCRRFEAESLADARVRKRLQDYVCVKVDVKATIPLDGKQKQLLKQPAFREMLGRPGIAIIDFTKEDSPLYGKVVSTFPLTSELRYPPEHMLVILDLPRGTLTQRTLIYAVRVHPERPASTQGKINAYLVSEAASHSKHQARIHLQGHHNWDSRFHRINGKLPAGLRATEVCAESWPGEHLVEAAVECVRCWRYSEGHWSAVRAYHPVYGYDMQRGSNGIWYATGIFGKGHLAPSVARRLDQSSGAPSGS